MIDTNMTLSANWDDDELDQAAAIFTWEIRKIEQKIRHELVRTSDPLNPRIQNLILNQNREEPTQPTTYGQNYPYNNSGVLSRMSRSRVQFPISPVVQLSAVIKSQNPTEVVLQNCKSGLKIKVSLTIVDSADVAIKITLSNNANLGKYFCKFILLDQSTVSDKKHVIVMEQPCGNLPVRFFPLKLLTKTSGLSVDQFEADNETYVQNDTITVRIILYPMSYIHNSIATKNGILFWKISNYAQTKRDVFDGVVYCLYSQPFYTSEYGFRVQAKVFINGFAKNGNQNVVAQSNAIAREYFAIQIDFVPGNFDGMLPKAFGYEISVSLLEQRNSAKKNDFYQNYEYCPSNPKSIQGIIADQKTCIFQEFLLGNLVENPHYLKDDSLLFKIEVDIY